ncbi:MAG: hypothetical protein QG673_836 [Pseudomonadota bacterium]|nr:hypothetical protein [Pseudomonadota bacterium]
MRKHDKHNILVMGAGRIGVAVSSLLSNCGDYTVYLSDVKPPFKLPLIKNNPIEFITADITRPHEIRAFIKEKNIEAVISCLPFYLTFEVAKIAADCKIHYFDPTEDVATTKAVFELADSLKHDCITFVPQCGLAPGFISIAANSLINGMNDVQSIKMRVGALTQSTHNSLKYGITWSIDGLINEYIHPCTVLKNGVKKSVPSMSGLEELTIDGVIYEAFYTSGGIGSMPDTFAGKVQSIDYKTIRYPGHYEKMAFLLHDLKLIQSPALLKDILQNAIAHVEDDKVVIYVAAIGYTNGRLTERAYTNTLYPSVYDGHKFTAIQMSTASGICTVVDLVIKHKKFKGIVLQEQISLEEFLNNRFGVYYTKFFNTNGIQ